MESKRRKLNVSKRIPTLDCLNDDCLLHLLKMLSLKDRIIVERVCKRWRELCQVLWRQQRVLCISKYEYVSYLHCPKIKHLKNIFIRCGDHLKIVKVNRIPGAVALNLIGKYCANIVHLTLIGISVTYDAIKFLSTSCTSLQKLHLHNCRGVTDDLLKCLLLANNNIQILKLEGCHDLTGTFFNYVPTSIQDLFVQQCNLSSDIFVHNFKRNHSLLKLNIIFAKHSLEHSIIKCIVNRAPQLQDLSLSYCKSNSHHYLKQLKNLTSLTLNENQLLNDNSLKRISKGCLNLESLNIVDCTNITNDGINYLRNLPNLKRLNIKNIKIINDDSLVTLSNVKTLMELNCSGCRLITNRGACAILNSCTNLTYFELDWCKSVTVRTIKESIKVMKKRQSNLPLTLRIRWTGLIQPISKTLPKLLTIDV